ncbi:rCG59607 [Rattus norvegicus]|uniref:RCG59607 n=1 Tax=Rattus norvegicus TaxID=10116 RepID=A6HSF5_RAT|nr:rCG59607 [Rattus norvegicus]
MGPDSRTAHRCPTAATLVSCQKGSVCTHNRQALLQDSSVQQQEDSQGQCSVSGCHTVLLEANKGNRPTHVE